MNTRRAVMFGCAALALSALGGCGLPIESSPQAIPANQIPRALSQNISTNFILPGKLHHAAVTNIYLVGPNNELVPVPRFMKAPVTPQKVLYALDAGPLPSESGKGIQSYIPSGAELVADGVSHGVLTVLLDSSFGSLDAQQATYEFAQIVMSATSLPGINGVAFEYDGNNIKPVIGNGSLAPSYVVGRSDYEQLLAPGASPRRTTTHVGIKPRRPAA